MEVRCLYKLGKKNTYKNQMSAKTQQSASDICKAEKIE